MIQHNPLFIPVCRNTFVHPAAGSASRRGGLNSQPSGNLYGPHLVKRIEARTQPELVTKGTATRNKKLLATPGIACR